MVTFDTRDLHFESSHQQDATHREGSKQSLLQGKCSRAEAHICPIGKQIWLMPSRTVPIVLQFHKHNSLSRYDPTSTSSIKWLHDRPVAKDCFRRKS